jgi:cytochrome oxidase Cu insertion factor (SCO1/SenC/PrrC family)
MKGSALPIWLCVVVLALAAYGGLKIWRSQQSKEPFTVNAMSNVDQSAPLPKLTEFTLTERSGKKFHSRQWLGEVWVASVFFSACPSVCLELNKTIAELQKDERFRDVKFVSITCDTRNDTLPVLTSYANRFGADKDRWLFCTGDQKEVERVAHDMLQIAVQGVTHSERAIIFDRTGKSRGAFVIANPRFIADRINFERTLQECLAEPRAGSAEGNAETAAAKAIESGKTAHAEQPPADAASTPLAKEKVSP